MSEDDVITGPVRTPRNLAANVTGSIHDDATATALGFRGGTVAGSIHMDQFPPLLLDAFGPRWFETGSLSLYFRTATTDGEPVRALYTEADLPDASMITRISQQVGGSFGVAVGAVVLESVVASGHQPSQAFSQAFWWTIGFTVVAGLASFVLGLIVRDTHAATAVHIIATATGLAAMGIGLYAQMVSSTRNQRVLIVTGIIAGFVGLAIGLSRGGFVG